MGICVRNINNMRHYVYEYIHINNMDLVISYNKCD